MRLVNLTPHALTLRLPSGEDMILAPSGQIARVVSPDAGAPRALEDLPVPVAPAPEAGRVEGLPTPEAGVAYVVSGLVLAHGDVAGRADVYGPGTGPAHGAIRAGGQIVAVTCLVAAPGGAR